MRKLSLSTALVSLLMLYSIEEVLACSNCTKEHKKGLIHSEKIHSNKYPFFKIGGDFLSYGWVVNQEGNDPVISPFQDYSRGYGAMIDGTFSITAEGQNNNLGISYGFNVEFDTPYIKKSDFTASTAINNRGTKLFVNTAYGNFTIGYQKGVDSIMKIDAFTIGTGDNGNSWLKYVNLRNEFFAGYNFGEKNTDEYIKNAFYLPTGLYMEGLFDGMNRFSYNHYKYQNSGTLINSLPLRVSYISPNVLGFSVGISYSPFGYDYSSVLRANINNNSSLSRKAKDDVVKVLINYDIMEKITNMVKDITDYEVLNVIEGKLMNLEKSIQDVSRYTVTHQDKIEYDVLNIIKDSYEQDRRLLIQDLHNKDYDYDYNLRESISNIIENITRKMKIHRGFIAPIYDNIVNLGLTYKVNLRDVNIQTSITSEYAHFKSIQEQNNEFVIMPNIKSIAVGAVANYKTAKIAASYGYLGEIDSIVGKYEFNAIEEKFLYNDNGVILGSSYFWTVGASYGYKGTTVSTSYRKSVYGAENRLYDIGAGVEYTFSEILSKLQYKIFANYHYFTAHQKLHDDYKQGSILLIGMKCEF
ncbi:hypothetical protein [Candidatus Neoehrlichia procyonis]|uniref:Outer membrane insertion C-terminal signal domain protein n=1 Tax=Candidatus Neoehrlichia procyonis str. RAC413 TaxID=1359163 RepID=A0A0F3NME0_9RICK|nr:hypothetical protein [Candidatus Neoehrlichia lotoris]KJV68951.1 outer membrane insertion C-terminal signal domain protein [Candidatus Neoehrlichia lotoris str. RAC413]